MKTLASVLALGAIAATTAVHATPAAPDADRFGFGAHAVFVMTNDANANEVIAFERTSYGTLEALIVSTRVGGAAEARSIHWRRRALSRSAVTAMHFCRECRERKPVRVSGLWFAAFF